MSEIAMRCMRDDPHLLSKRLKKFVESIPAKELARHADCDIRTAENIRRGHWPIARHWLGLLTTFGEDLTEAVFHPEKAAARLERECKHLEEQLARKRADLSAAQSGSPGVAQAPAPTEDRTAAHLNSPQRPIPHRA